MGEKWPYIKTEDDMSLMVSIDSTMITSAIEAHGGRYMATIYIPGYYLYTDSY